MNSRDIQSGDPALIFGCLFDWAWRTRWPGGEKRVHFLRGCANPFTCLRKRLSQNQNKVDLPAV